MFTYSISFVRENGIKSYNLVHDKDFSIEEMDKMVKQAKSEMRWIGIINTFGTIDNYMCDMYGFTKQEKRRIFEYKD